MTDEALHIIDVIRDVLKTVATKEDVAVIRAEIASLYDRLDRFRNRCDERHQDVQGDLVSLRESQAVSAEMRRFNECQASLETNRAGVSWTKAMVIVAGSTALLVKLIEEIAKRW